MHSLRYIIHQNGVAQTRHLSLAAIVFQVFSILFKWRPLFDAPTVATTVLRRSAALERNTTCIFTAEKYSLSQCIRAPVNAVFISHRTFLATLILTYKNLNNISPRNEQWVELTTVCGFKGLGLTLTEVNYMERDIPARLDWNLQVTMKDLYDYLQPFLAATPHGLALCEEYAKGGCTSSATALERIIQGVSAQICHQSSADYVPGSAFDQVLQDNHSNDLKCQWDKCACWRADLEDLYVSMSRQV